MIKDSFHDMTSLGPCLGVPRVALHWNSTLPPVLTVWEV